MYDDVSALKDLGIRPSYFGLGMVQMNMSPTERLNFYHPDLELSVNPNVEYHDHRYDFKSKVIVGELVQKFVHFVPNRAQGDHKMVTVSCDKDNPAPESTDIGNIYMYKELTTYAGSAYHINGDVFHSVHTNNKPCLTQIIRPAKATKAFAKVITPIEYETTCPFATNLTTDDCWDVISKVLEYGKTQ